MNAQNGIFSRNPVDSSNTNRYMSIPKKGTRKITVGATDYRWLIRRKATYSQTDYGNGCMHVAIEHAETPGTTLLIHTDRKHPKDWATKEVIAVTPSDVSKWITQALELGWKPAEQGSQWTVEIAGNEMRMK